MALADVFSSFLVELILHFGGCKNFLHVIQEIPASSVGIRGMCGIRPHFKTPEFPVIKNFAVDPIPRRLCIDAEIAKIPDLWMVHVGELVFCLRKVVMWIIIIVVG